MICLQKVFYEYLGAFGGEQMFIRLYFALNDVKKEGFVLLCSAYFVYFHLKRSSYESL